jgi:hypothetical protein
MTKKLEILLKVIFTIVLVGFTLTALLVFVNEEEIAVFFAAATAYIAAPLLIIAVAMDIKIN